MKKIEAVIRPEKLDDVKVALEAAGYPGLMLTRIEGHGKQKGLMQQFR
ncbi:MAG: P-II family nitrogen regulator, partial [Actinomycetota bacterium]|nr:P-II family nitrogen regulator [Actinomycetota bacterium]